MRTMTTDHYVQNGDQIGAHRLFQPVVLTPGQYTEPRPFSHRFGFVRLAAAILEQTVDEIRRIRQGRLIVGSGHVPSAARSERLYKENMDWIRSTDVCWVFSFANICGYLGLDVDATRARLLDEKVIPGLIRSWLVGRHNMELNTWLSTHSL